MVIVMIEHALSVGRKCVVVDLRLRAKMRVGFVRFMERVLFATVIETSNVLTRLLLTFLVFARPRLPVFFIG